MNTNPEDLLQVGRLAFREEGTMWNCYFAKPTTMEGAILLGSCAMTASRVPAIREAFMNLMRQVMNRVLAEELGVMPVWKDPKPAPPHEKGGKA